MALAPKRIGHVAVILLSAAVVATSSVSCTTVDVTIADDANPARLSTSRLTFETARPLVAGSTITEEQPLVVVFTAGTPLERGSLVAVAFPTAVQEEAGDLWSIPTMSPAEPGTCRIDERDSGTAELAFAGRSKGGAGRIVFRTSRRIEAGESVRVCMSGQVPKIVPRQPFRVLELDSRSGALCRVPDGNQHLPPVVSGRAVFVSAILPCDARIGESVRLRLVALDTFGNVDAAFRGPVTLSGPVDGLPKTVSFAEEQKGLALIDGLTCSKGGIARIAIVAAIDSGELKTQSNPMKVWPGTPPTRRFAGDSHFHSGSDVASLSTDGGDHRGQFVDSDAAFSYLRDVSGADWGISAEHDTGLSESTWLENQKRVSAIEANGRFVTLNGFEWTPPRRFGHHVVVFEGTSEAGNPLIGASSGRRGGEGASNVAELVETLRSTSTTGNRVLVIPHVMQPFPNGDDDREGHELPHETWDGPPGRTEGSYVFNDLRRVGEMYSHHNDDFTIDGYRQTREGRGDAVNQPQLFELGIANSWSYQHAWATGHRIGVIGGSDNHFGTPGMNDYASTVPHHAGLAMVFAADLTHSAIFGSLYDRRCYATTGPRILVELSVDGLQMGEEATRAVGSRIPIAVSVSGTVAVESVEILKFERGDFVVLPGRLSRTSAMDVSVTFDDTTVASTLYYVRIRQSDGEWAWTSPVWIDVTPS